MIKLLVVDDEPGIRRAIKRVFRREDYEVTAVASCRAALEKIASQEFNVILCNSLMPDDGEHFWETVEDIAPGARSKVVYLTGRVDKKDFHGRPVVRKPFDIDFLVAVVEDVAKRE
jgi:two-component system KDP operon response regulator KdpE